MTILRESMIYQLWLALLAVYDESRLHALLVRLGAWCNRQIDESRILQPLCREGVVARAWPESGLCRLLTGLVNLPGWILHKLYCLLPVTFEDSFFARLAFQVGDEAAIAQSWVILLLWCIPFAYWNNAYSLMGFVLVLALFGVNVMALLMFGSVLAGTVGLLNGSFDFFGFLKGAGDGALSMSETLIVALLAGGLLKVIRYNGGIGYLLGLIERHIRGRRGGEFGIALLVSAVNVFTANNTVAIVIAGPIARDISERYDIAPARSASILDTSSCIVQGILPYGAQVLAAVGLAGAAVSAFDVLAFLWYPYVLAFFLILAIALGFPRSASRS